MAKKTKITNWQLKNKIYILRSCNKNFQAYNNFQWPKLSGWAETPIYVECPDWKSTSSCGNGLHGYVEGKGDGSELKLDGFAQIVEVEKDEIIYLDDKCKFPRCNLLFCGSYKEATDFLYKQGYSHPILKAFIVVGDDEVAAVGNLGSATAGNKGAAIAGYKGTSTVNNSGTATAGNEGTATAGHGGTATAGHGGIATAGDYGTATAGYKGTATAGDYGTATAGEYGTATTGDFGTATAGDFGTATTGIGGTALAGISGRIIIEYYDGNRIRLKVGYIGENGLLPNVKYNLAVDGKFRRAKPISKTRN